MTSLFKYLPSEFVDKYLGGEILFRPLSYFIKLAADNRGDLHEGTHVDRPGKDVTLDLFERDGKTFKKRLTGDFAMRRSLKHPHRVFIHCTSKCLDPQLFERFQSDACIEIFDPLEFSNLLRPAIKERILHLEKHSVQFDNVEYYDISRAKTMRDIEIPLSIPFFKPAEYSMENEFRFVFARQGGMETKMAITNAAYNRLSDEKLRQAQAQKFIKIGSIKDICKVHRTNQ